jgi:hypothetical protein
MLALHAQTPPRSEHEKSSLSRQIQLVDELYGLNDDEIRIVEQSTSNAAAGWIKPIPQRLSGRRLCR